jgi:prevent-host-death family protein
VQDVNASILAYNQTMPRITLTQARRRWPETLELVQAGEDVELTRRGEVVAVIVPASTSRSRIQTANTVAADGLLARLKPQKFDDLLGQGAFTPEELEEDEAYWKSKAVEDRELTARRDVRLERLRAELDDE